MRNKNFVFGVECVIVIALLFLIRILIKDNDYTTVGENNNIDLDEFLQSKVFKNVSKEILYPDKEDVDGFNKYLDDYKKILEVERKAIEVL